jgi:hypothetical protein
MAAPVIGAGVLRVVDRLQDASYALFEPVINQQFPAPISAGSQTIPIADPTVWVPAPCFYVGAQIVCGVTGGNLEVVTVTAVNVGVSFTATFQNAHAAGEWINGATFPVRYPTDPLFTQQEMLAYISTATNDFLTDVPLAYNIADLTVSPTEQNTPLPADSLFPVRLAYDSYPLRETSQSNLDGMYYPWAEQALSQPRVYFRDKIPLQNVGIWPRMGNTVDLEVVYAQRQAQTMGWGDGWIVPDCLTQYVLYRTLSFAFSKDGEARNPGLAKYFQSRYDFGVKVCKMLLEIINDPQAQ